MTDLYLTEFLLLYTANFINLVSPGAGVTITMRNAYMHGRVAGLLTGAGIVLSSIGHKLISMLGFSWILTHHPLLFYTIKYGGCAFLIYLGIKCLLSGYRLRVAQKRLICTAYGSENTAVSPSPSARQILKNWLGGPPSEGRAKPCQDRTPITKWQAFRTGYITDLLNPMASIAFLSLVSNTISPSTPRYLLFTYVALLICTSLWWYSTLALLFSNKKLSLWLEKYKAFLEYANGGFLVYIGLRILT